jgi:hypothetical protein
MIVYLVYLEYNDVFNLDNVYATEELAKTRVKWFRENTNIPFHEWYDYNSFEVIGENK